jgi:hypothetical protein
VEHKAVAHTVAGLRDTAVAHIVVVERHRAVAARHTVAAQEAEMEQAPPGYQQK